MRNINKKRVPGCATLKHSGGLVGMRCMLLPSMERFAKNQQQDKQHQEAPPPPAQKKEEEELFPVFIRAEEEMRLDSSFV